MKTTNKEAVNQQLQVLTAQIGKHVASYLVPNYNDGQKLAIVDEGVLKYLKSLLPYASAEKIVSTFIYELQNLLNLDLASEKLLIRAVTEAKEFVAFQESINLMKRYFDPTVTVIRDEPFNAEPRELTITEMIAERNIMAEALAKYDDAINKHPDYPQPSLSELMKDLEKMENGCDFVRSQIHRHPDNRNNGPVVVSNVH